MEFCPAGVPYDWLSVLSQVTDTNMTFQESLELVVRLALATVGFLLLWFFFNS